MILMTCGRADAERMINGDERAYIISIYTPGDEPAKLSETWENVLQVALPDNSDPVPESVLGELVGFIEAALRGERQDYDEDEDEDDDRGVEQLVIHCDAGIGRSVGMARAIAQRYNLDYRSPHSGNVTIKVALLQALLGGEQMTPCPVDPKLVEQLRGGMHEALGRANGPPRLRIYHDEDGTVTQVEPLEEDAEHDEYYQV